MQRTVYFQRQDKDVMFSFSSVVMAAAFNVPAIIFHDPLESPVQKETELNSSAARSLEERGHPTAHCSLVSPVSLNLSRPYIVLRSVFLVPAQQHGGQSPQKWGAGGREPHRKFQPLSFSFTGPKHQILAATGTVLKVLQCLNKHSNR